MCMQCLICSHMRFCDEAIVCDNAQTYVLYLYKMSGGRRLDDDQKR